MTLVQTIFVIGPPFKRNSLFKNFFCPPWSQFGHTLVVVLDVLFRRFSCNVLTWSLFFLSSVHSGFSPSSFLVNRFKDFFEHRKNYDEGSPLHENLQKSMSKTTTKVRPNYNQGGQKKFLKSLFLLTLSAIANAKRKRSGHLVPPIE